MSSSIIKAGLMDISPYIYGGILLDDLDDYINNILKNKYKHCIGRVIDTMLLYKIDTEFKDDADIYDMMDDIESELVKLLGEKLDDERN